MWSACFALFAKLHEFELTLHLFLVLGGVVICTLTFRALHSEKVVLGHRINVVRIL